MNEKIGRRGLLRIVAGAVAGAVGACALADKVDARTQTLHMGPELHSMHSTRTGVLNATNVSVPAVTGIYTSMHLPRLADPINSLVTWVGPASGNFSLVNNSILPPASNELRVAEATAFPDYDPAFKITRDDDGWTTLKIE